MGYYTSYSLEVENIGSYSFDDIDAAIGDINDYFVNSNDKGPFVWADNEDTWYEHEADMIKLSAKFPDILFILNGAGDSYGDLWRKYFKRGLIQRAPAEIIFAEFDESQLGSLEDGSE